MGSYLRALFLALLLCCAPAWAGTNFDPGLAGFEIEIRGLRNPYRVLGVFAQPGETLELKLPGPEFSLFDAGGAEMGTRDADRLLRWTAPNEPGLAPLEIRRANADRGMTLNVFVLVPSERVRDGKLDGYRIDAYPARPLRDLARYRAPGGFVEVTPETGETLVSPHFRLKQFLCKQEGGPPRFVVLHERLLLKLELVLRAVNERLLRADTLHVMSGYRTPFYNRAIGNVQYSRHVYGDGADVFVDSSPRDDLMDDLDGNGTIDLRDAKVLYAIVDDLEEHDGSGLVGGLAAYPATAAHGPYVHLDVRGYRARW